VETIIKLIFYSFYW